MICIRLFNLRIMYRYPLNLKKKCRFRAHNVRNNNSKPLTGFIQMDDAYWGGKKRDGKRGRGATGKIPFVAAVSTNKDGHPVAMRFSQVSSFSKEAIQSWAQKVRLCLMG